MTMRVGGDYGKDKDRERKDMGWEVGRDERKVPLYSTIEIHVDLSLHVGPLLNIPGNGCCGELVEGYCVSNSTNRIVMKVSGFDKQVTIYFNTNKSFKIDPIKYSHFHGSLKVFIEYIPGPEVNDRNISCTDINGGLFNVHVYK